MQDGSYLILTRILVSPIDLTKEKIKGVFEKILYERFSLDFFLILKSLVPQMKSPLVRLHSKMDKTQNICPQLKFPKSEYWETLGQAREHRILGVAADGFIMIPYEHISLSAWFPMDATEASQTTENNAASCTDL